MSQLESLNRLEGRMQWLAARQQVLTNNIANADTPGYRAMEVKEPSFKSTLQHLGGVQLAQTNERHISATRTSTASGEIMVNRRPIEVSPTGNSVNLEDEMSKAAQNVMDYQLATNLYRKQINMLMTAAGRPR
jgi:flagellar basal-body rod protein FlgB